MRFSYFADCRNKRNTRSRSPLPQMLPRSKNQSIWRGFLLLNRLILLVEPRGVEPLTS